MDDSALNPAQRARALESMAATPVDVLVIGGGVTGAGVALDAVTRGLRVGLVEQRDYASGTSSRSSKLFHGGLRYLQRLQIGLVREALAERNLMMGLLCPHLTRPISFLYPVGHHIWERPYIGAGVALYDFLARLTSNPLPRHQRIGGDEIETLAPAIDRSKTRGAIRYWDVLVDDARHTMTVARTAAAHGAHLATSARVVGMLPRSDSMVVELVDLEADRHLSVRAGVVVNATGVWTDRIQSMLGDEERDVRPSKGVHLVVPRDKIDSQVGMILRTRLSVLLVIPWERHWIIGTTDTPWDLGLAHPAASRSDIDYLLEKVNRILARPLGHDDVVGVYAGLRPLLSGESAHTSRLSREHAVIDDGRRLVTVTGGKYTTYRVMAAEAVDALEPYLGDLAPSATRQIPLIGAEGYQQARSGLLPDGVQADQHERLLGRYGSRVSDLADSIRRDPSLGTPIVPDAPYLRAEIEYAVTHEGALHLDDVLTRRTHMSIETRHRGLDAAEDVAALMSGPLGWSRSDIQRELQHYEARVAAEIDSQRQPDDRTADAARMGAPDVRGGAS